MFRYNLFASMAKPPFSEDKHPFDRMVVWFKTSDAEFPYEARVGAEHWVIRVNDWPDEPTVFTLLVDEVELLNFDGWGDNWTRPT